MDSPHTQVVASISTIALAAVGGSSLIEWLPKSAVVALCILLFAIVGFFVKRDYGRIGEYMAASNVRLASIESNQRHGVTREEHGASVDGVHRKIDTLFDKLTDQHHQHATRLTIVETKLGVYDAEEEV